MLDGRSGPQISISNAWRTFHRDPTTRKFVKRDGTSLSGFEGVSNIDTRTLFVRPYVRPSATWRMTF